VRDDEFQFNFSAIMKSYPYAMATQHQTKTPDQIDWPGVEEKESLRTPTN
jgi:hypothetical protein